MDIQGKHWVISNDHTKECFEKHLDQMYKSKGYVTIRWTEGKTRSNAQNNALHLYCRQLAEGLCGIGGIEVDPEEVETNMLFIETGKHDAATLTQKLDELGIRVLATGPSTLRAVTNLTFQADEVDRLIHTFKQIL